MPFNSLVARTDANALIPEDVAGTIIQSMVTESATLSLFQHVVMSRAQQRMPVLSALPVAYWVNGDTGLKQTTQMAWANKYINAEELAAIVPIPENVLDDSDFDLWGTIRPRIAEAIARALDAAVFFGTNAPASFPTNIAAAALAAGNNVDIASATTAANGGVFSDVDQAIAKIEADGFAPNGYVTVRTRKAAFRAARNTLGDRLDRDRISPDFSSYDGDPIVYSMDGLWPTGGGAGTNASFFGMDRSQFILGIRKDITLKALDQAVITDAGGLVVYNLPQQDMVALRVTFRAGWQVANPLTLAQPTEASRYPAAVIRY